MLALATQQNRSIDEEVDSNRSLAMASSPSCRPTDRDERFDFDVGATGRREVSCGFFSKGQFSELLGHNVNVI